MAARTTTPSTKPATAPVIESVETDAEYKAAWNNLQELRTRLSEANRTLTESVQIGVENFDAVEGLVKGVEYLDRREVSQRGSRSVTINPRSRMSEEEVQKAQIEVQRLTKAIALQNDVLTRIRFQVSQQRAAELYPQYRALVRDICTAMAKLDEASERERLFREAVNDAQIGWVHPLTVCNVPATVCAPRHARINDSNACVTSRYIRDAEDAGYLSDTLPQPTTTRHAPPPPPAPAGTKGVNWSTTPEDDNDE